MSNMKLTIKHIAEKLKKREISVPELTKAYLNRIQSEDGKYNCYITVCEEQAMEQAKKVQEKFDRKEPVSALAGIPCGIKDNICTKDILTTCASKMLYNFIPPYNATAVQKLLDNDCIILGKLNMDEFAMGSTTENSYYKKTRNPHDLSKVPGGSSGGSAAAIAANLAVFTLGSDTGGSIRQPAAFCGVTGLKPTYGAVSRYGLVAFASSLDQIGPLTHNVEDCATVLNTIAGKDKMDATSAITQHPDYTSFLKNDIKGLKIAVPKEYTGEGVDAQVANKIQEVAEKFAKLGACCHEISLPLTQYAVPAYYILSSAEASSNLARYDGIRYGYRAGKFNDLSELYTMSRSEAFGAEVKRRIMLGTYVLSSGYYDAYYKKALQVRTMIMDEFDRVFKDYDIILGPVSPTVAYGIGEKINDPLEMYMGDIFTVSANIAGLPAISVPAGYNDEGLPIGMQLIAKPFNEAALIRVGYTYETNNDEVKL